MIVGVLALRGFAAVAVLTTLAGGIPRIAQAALAVTLGLWSALLVAPAHATFVSWAFAVQELAIGSALGVMAAVPLLAAAAAGRLVDLASSGRAEGPYGRLFGVLAAAVFVAIDGHVEVVRAIARSHRTISALGAARPGVLAAVAALVPSAIRLAVPWLVTAAVVAIAVGAGVRVAGRAGGHVATASAVPVALVMMTASLVATLAVTLVALVRGAL